jgi:hypothetical protein
VRSSLLDAAAKFRLALLDAQAETLQKRPSKGDLIK